MRSGAAQFPSTRYLRGDGAPIGADEGQRRGLIFFNFELAPQPVWPITTAPQRCPSSGPSDHLLPANGGEKGRVARLTLALAGLIT